MSSYVTINCGPSHKSGRSSRPTNNNSLADYMPKFESSGGINRRTVVVKSSVDSNNSFAVLAEERRPTRPTETNKPTGSWGKRLTVSDAVVKQLPRKPVPVLPTRVSTMLTRPCAYCHDEEHIHHIRDCPILAEKNRHKAERSHKEKESHSRKKRLQAEARFAEKVRLIEKHEQVVVVEESSDSDSSDSSDGEVEEYPALTAAIASGKVTVRRGSRKIVSFKDDSENLMKPPCDTKVFNKEDAPWTISSDEEQEDDIVLLKCSANAWKPKRFWKMPMTAHERQFILDEIAEKEADIKLCDIDSWADDADIEELEDAIKKLKAKLA